jgi:hypothetical protein
MLLIGGAPKEKLYMPTDERFGPINYFFEEYDPKYFPLWANICPVWPESGNLYALIYGAVVFWAIALKTVFQLSKKAIGDCPLRSHL